MTYTAPVDDLMAALVTTGRFNELGAQGLYDGLDLDTARAIFEEAGNFASGVLDPLNGTGDREGCHLKSAEVTTPKGFKEAYQQFSDGGWSALPGPSEFGGQGLPSTIAMAVSEIWSSSNLAFGMCPLLTNGAIDAIEIGGSKVLKARYLPNMISGRWTGTMNLTEPQAGSDLNALTTKAERHADGSYRITGTKIYISFGEHDMAENIIHLVLARLPDGAPGTRGISLFLVPKFQVNDNGTLGARNDVVCAGIEHKMGIKASPTCVMKFGEQGGAVGYLIGEEHRGLATMFVMMNAARLAVGVQGVGIAERATQRAIHYASERRQGRAPNSTAPGMSPIIEHPDIRRTLLTMQALTKAARAICTATAAATDISHRAKDDVVRAAAAAKTALLTPLAKAFATDVAVDVASLGIQVHGGMGFVEDTGAAQDLRDARILPIYEGTNGIQAIDLVMRKLPNTESVKAYVSEVASTMTAVQKLNAPAFGQLALRLQHGLEALLAATEWMYSTGKQRPDAALVSATAYLRLFSIVAGGRYLADSALAAHGGEGGRLEDIGLARVFGDHVLSSAPALADTILHGADAILAAELQATA